jgi:hypothetical protein
LLEPFIEKIGALGGLIGEHADYNATFMAQQLDIEADARSGLGRAPSVSWGWKV